MTKVLVSGSAGFIGGYVVQELLQRGFEVIGVDNFSKYGPVKEALRRSPLVPVRGGRLPGHRAPGRFARGRRAFHCRRSHDRRDLIFPHLTRTTCWPTTRGSWPPLSTPPWPPTAMGSYAR